jgi:hypothetical protein
MKDWPEEWKVLSIPKKVPISNQQVEVVPSKKSTSPATNTRKETEHVNETRGSTTTRNPRQKNIIPKASVQEKEHVVEPNGGMQPETNIPMLKETGGGDLQYMDIPITIVQTETLPMKRIVLQAAD